jgi:hypothetical protein
MVDYHDPVTIAHEFSAYPSIALRGSQPNLPVLDSGGHEVLARCGRNIYVSLPVLPRQPPGSTWLNRYTPLLAGNSSPTWTMSGMSSEGIAPTDGRYGFVAFFPDFVTALFISED